MPEPLGTITIDASGATSGMDFEAFIRGGFIADATGGGFPVFDNSAAFSGEEMLIGYGPDATSKYVLAHGSLEYYFNTHTVAGTINIIQYGTRGSGTYDANGYFVGGSAELSITGLTLHNPIPTTPEEETEIEANGPVHNFAVAYMYGASAEQARLDKYADSLDAYAQSFIGSAHGDAYSGTVFNDTIDGKGGNDTMAGGDGNDTYIVDAADDVVVEAANQGVDLVKSFVTRTLGVNQEKLTLLGTDSINAIGNGLNNVLIGNSAANLLNGGVGNDTMIGGLGNDTFVVDSASDIVSEQANGGIDLVRSSVTRALGVNQENLTLIGAAAINATGNAQNNVLIGNSAANILNGLAGNDTMMGGLGDDIYDVDSTGDIVSEAANGGTDLIRSFVSRTLGVNQEKLTLYGAGSINGAGNADNNVLTGNSAANTLNGLAGNDTMAGGAGNDIYIVDSAGDVVFEQAGNGIDQVRSFVTRTLGANQENLALMGADAINGAGNADNNSLVGNTAANILNGGGGNDTINGAGGNDTINGGAGQDRMFGGIGADTFDFNNVIETAVGPTRDVIQDFEAGTSSTSVDRIDLSGIDANELVANNQAFSFIGGAAFTAGVAGQVRAVQLAGGQTLIQANTDGDVAAEFEILIANGINLSNLDQGDLIL